MRESQGIAFLHQRYRYFLLSAQFLSRENRKKVTTVICLLLGVYYMLEVLIYLDLGYVLKKKESWIYV